MRGRRIVPVLAALAVFVSPAARGVTCTVPSGGHPTIETAIDDASCTEVQLLAQSYDESLDIRRSLTIVGEAGGGSILLGQTIVSGATTVVTITDLAVDTRCPVTLRVGGGASLDGGPIDFVSSPGSTCPPPPDQIFGDGFEGGDTSAWSSTSP